MKKGKLITIEGCEGVGKSTQLAMLKQYFLDNGIDAVFTREPGGTDISEQIRKIILDKNNVEMDDVTELLLYMAARRQHTFQLIKACVEQGKIVVCDRYADSTMAYQGYARGIDKQMIKDLSKYAQGDVAIDVTLFLDLDPVRAFERKGGRDASDRMENEKLSFHQRVYEGFKAIAEEEPNRVAVIDASKPANDVFSEIIAQLKAREII